jgi:hypothetical protein
MWGTRSDLRPSVKLRVRRVHKSWDKAQIVVAIQQARQFRQPLIAPALFVTVDVGMDHMLEFMGELIRVAPPEYVIVRKLEYFREGGSEKHLRDIRSMLAVSGEQLDRFELNEWIIRRGVECEWQKACS